MQLGIGYTVHCEMARLGKSPHGQATRHVEEQGKVHPMSIKRPSEVAGEAPRHHLTKRGVPATTPCMGGPFKW
jgi:hypothetical protein